MAVSFTPHGDLRRGGISALSGQTGDVATVADDAVSSAVARPGLYRIIATTACTVKIGGGLTDAANGEYWPLDHMEVRYLGKGDIIAVDAI